MSDNVDFEKARKLIKVALVECCAMGQSAMSAAFEGDAGQARTDIGNALASLEKTHEFLMRALIKFEHIHSEQCLNRSKENAAA